MPSCNIRGKTNIRCSISVEFVQAETRRAGAPTYLLAFSSPTPTYTFRRLYYAGDANPHYTD